MAVGQHAVVKAEKIAAAAVVALGEETVLAKTVERRSFDEFKGAAGDKITFRVEGTLPVRTYEWRNDRAEQIVTDTYVEQTVDLTVEPNNDYSAVALIDEALEFDFAGAWGKLFTAQIKAVTGGLERRVRKQVIDAPYERVMALVASSAAKAAAHADGEDLVFNFFSDVQAELKALRNPDTNVVAVVGSGWANLLRKASKSTKNEGRGDGAFASNVIDTFAGITAVEDPTLGKNEGYVYAASAVLLFTAAPRVPLGAVKGAISNQNGFSLRWIQDYDASRQIDRSTFNSWIATGVTKDNLRQINSDGTKEIVDTVQYFVRGIKIVLAADSTAATAAEIKPGDGKTRTNGSLGSSATSTLAKVYNDQPFAGTLPAGDPFTIGHDVEPVVP